MQYSYQNDGHCILILNSGHLSAAFRSKSLLTSPMLDTSPYCLSYFLLIATMSPTHRMALSTTCAIPYVASCASPCLPLEPTSKWSHGIQGGIPLHTQSWGQCPSRRLNPAAHIRQAQARLQCRRCHPVFQSQQSPHQLQPHPPQPQHQMTPPPIRRIPEFLRLPRIRS